MVARRVHPARSPDAAGTAAVDARRRADVAQDGAEPFVERRVAAVVDLQPAEPLLDLSRSPGRRDTGALEGPQDRQVPAQEMVPAGFTDRADDPHVGVVLASLDRPAGVCRRRVARVHQVGEVLCGDEVLDEAGGLRSRFRASGTTRDGGGAGPPGSRQSSHRLPRPPRPRVTGSPGLPHDWQISALSAQAPVTMPRTRSAERLLVSPTGSNSSRPSASRRWRRVPSRWASRTVAVMRRRQPVIGSLYQPRLSFAGPSPVRAPRSGPAVDRWRTGRRCTLRQSRRRAALRCSWSWFRAPAVARLDSSPVEHQPLVAPGDGMGDGV